MAKDKHGNAILPVKTPKEIVDWVRKIEAHLSVNCLAQLPKNATLKEIKEAFDTDRSTLIGIGEDIYENARWDAWDSYEFRQENE